jgi:transposase
MEKILVSVGLDYHKASVQVCVLDQGGAVRLNRRCGNDVLEVARAVEEAAGAAGAWEVREVALEACAGAADFGERLADLTRWPVTLAHAGYVSRMRGNPDKTDYSDARMLAELCRVGFLPRVWLAPAHIRQLRRLVQDRQTLVEQRRATKLRILALLRECRVREPAELRRWNKVWLSWLESCDGLGEHGRWVMDRLRGQLGWLGDQIALVEERLEGATEHDPVAVFLRSIKGVGRVVGWMLRAAIGRFDRFANGKQMARFCGITPRNASSGERRADAGLIRAGDPTLRTALIEAAHRLRRFDPRWRALSERMREAGKPACVIIPAIANRWIRWLYHQINQGLAARGVSPAA